jgi:hypothetical protein
MSVTPSSFSDTTTVAPPDTTVLGLRERIEELTRENQRLRAENESLNHEVRSYLKSLYALTRSSNPPEFDPQELAEAMANPIPFEKVVGELEKELGVTLPRPKDRT